MNITITRQHFEDRDACEEGMDALDELVERLGGWSDEGTVTLWWDWVAYVWALLSHSSFVIWALKERLLPSWDLSRANLYGANLSGANLYGANLSRADLYGANLDLARNKDLALGLPKPVEVKTADAAKAAGATP